MKNQSRKLRRKRRRTADGLLRRESKIRERLHRRKMPQTAAEEAGSVGKVVGQTRFADGKMHDAVVYPAKIGDGVLEVNGKKMRTLPAVEKLYKESIANIGKKFNLAGKEVEILGIGDRGQVYVRNGERIITPDGRLMAKINRAINREQGTGNGERETATEAPQTPLEARGGAEVQSSSSESADAPEAAQTPLESKNPAPRQKKAESGGGAERDAAAGRESIDMTDEAGRAEARKEADAATGMEMRRRAIEATRFLGTEAAGSVAELEKKLKIQTALAGRAQSERARSIAERKRKAFEDVLAYRKATENLRGLEGGRMRRGEKTAFGGVEQFFNLGEAGAGRLGTGRLDEAERMEKDGASREDIWRTTGWWRGRDGKWRVELSGVKMKDERALFRALIDGENGRNETLLGELLDAPELFKAYPELADVKVVLSPEEASPGESAGWFDRKKNEITILDAGLVSLRDMPFKARDLRNTYEQTLASDEVLDRRLADMDAFGIEHGTKDEEREYARRWIERQDDSINKTNETRLRDMAGDRRVWSVFGKLVHEVQHAVQQIEGFARGASGEEAGYGRFAGEVEARNAARREAMSPEERAATPPWETEDVPEDRQIVRMDGGGTADIGRAIINGREMATVYGYPLSIRDARDPVKVLKLLSPLVGKSAAQLGEMKLTRITEKSVEHLINASHARSDSRASGRDAKKLWRGTVAGMSVVNDIVATSPLGTRQVPRHLNAEWKKGAIFYAADTQFAVEVGDGRYEVYPCKLIVSERNGRRIVYDLTEIGTPTPTTSANPRTRTVGGPQRGVTANGGVGASMPKSITQRAEEVNSAGDGGGQYFNLDEAGKAKREEEKKGLSGLYTGSAADYARRDENGNIVNGPSLHHVGTGEGVQVYGWGLYASNKRGVAERYARGTPHYEWQKNGKPLETDIERWAARKIFNYDTAEKAIDSLKSSRDLAARSPRLGKFTETDAAILRELEEHGPEYEMVGGWTGKHIYEQTFFTDRPEGDESHLLKWYEPVTKKQKKRIKAQAEKEGLNVSNLLWDGGEIQGAMLYNYLATPSYLGSPKAASEFLARAGIDGVKYPVDSYGKTVKDGDKAGWNYVSFRDDNIRVDHKWTDGVQQYFNLDEAGARRVRAKGKDEAEKMLAEGKSREEIWRQTGWWKAKDNKWRYEVAGLKDAEVQQMLNFARAMPAFRSKSNINEYSFTIGELEKEWKKLGGRLPDSLKILTAAYPKMRDVKITVDKKAKQPAATRRPTRQGAKKEPNAARPNRTKARRKPARIRSSPARAMP